jgi:rod shape determining protein RodA
MAVDRRLLFNMDWVLLGAVVLLCCTGAATIYSATYTGRFSGLYLRQLYWVAVGMTILAVSLMADYRRLVDRSPLLYLGLLAALVSVLLFGPKIAGTRRWFVLGPVQIQPSEFAKIVGALLLAKVFSESKKDSLGLFDLAAPGIAVGIMAVLIAAEPDLGTAFCLVPMFLAVAFLAGLRVRAILGLGVVFLSMAAVTWQFARPYQKERVYIFVGAKEDPRGAGYQSDQSRIAVGSGGLTGRGYMNGSQSQLGYLPARHTDFIFSVLAEEMGFIGVAVVLGLARSDWGVPGGRDHGRAHLPGHLQCRHGGRAGSGQGTASAVHELWWVVHTFIPARRWPRSQRPHATLCELAPHSFPRRLCAGIVFRSPT